MSVKRITLDIFDTRFPRIPRIESQLRTGRPRAICGQRYPKGTMSFRTQGYFHLFVCLFVEVRIRASRLRFKPETGIYDLRLELSLGAGI